MKKSLIVNFTFLLLLGTPLTAGAGKVLEEYIRVNPYSLPGDVERNHLPVPGISYHDANDFFGDTDKLVTEVSTLNFLTVWKERYSTSLSYKGRFLQPILKRKHGEQELPAPLGIYAEWAEVMLNQSAIWEVTSWVAFKLDGGIGYNDFGNHVFADYHRKIHSAVGSKNQEDRYGDLEDANFFTATTSASLVFSLSTEINAMSSFQVMNSKLFRENAQEFSLVWSKSPDFAASVKYSFIKQIRSEYYELRNNRTQMTAALRLFRIWTPSIMKVSTYVKGDKYGQWYLTPISLTYPF